MNNADFLPSPLLLIEVTKVEQTSAKQESRLSPQGPHGMPWSAEGIPGGGSLPPPTFPMEPGGFPPTSHHPYGARTTQFCAI